MAADILNALLYGGEQEVQAGYVGAAYCEQYDGKVKDRFPVVSLVPYRGSGSWEGTRMWRTRQGCWKRWA